MSSLKPNGYDKIPILGEPFLFLARRPIADIVYYNCWYNVNFIKYKSKTII
jgi:hypothetical protein